MSENGSFRPKIMWFNFRSIKTQNYWNEFEKRRCVTLLPLSLSLCGYLTSSLRTTQTCVAQPWCSVNPTHVFQGHFEYRIFVSLVLNLKHCVSNILLSKEIEIWKFLPRWHVFPKSCVVICYLKHSTNGFSKFCKCLRVLKSQIFSNRIQNTNIFVLCTSSVLID